MITLILLLTATNLIMFLLTHSQCKNNNIKIIDIFIGIYLSICPVTNIFMLGYTIKKLFECNKQFLKDIFYIVNIGSKIT